MIPENRKWFDSDSTFFFKNRNIKFGKSSAFFVLFSVIAEHEDQVQQWLIVHHRGHQQQLSLAS